MSSSFLRGACSNSSNRENDIENLSFKRSVRLLIVRLFIGDSFIKQLLLNTQLQEQWLVPLVEYPVQSPPKAYLEPIHISKMDFL